MLLQIPIHENSASSSHVWNGIFTAITSSFEQDSYYMLNCIAAIPAGPVVSAILLAYTEPRSPAILLPVVDPTVATKLSRNPDKKWYISSMTIHFLTHSGWA